MFSGLIRKVSQAELANTPKPLELRRINQPGDQLAFPRIEPQTNYVVYRIAIYAFGQRSTSQRTAAEPI